MLELKITKIWVNFFFVFSYQRDVAIKIINKNAIPKEVVDKFLPRELEITSKVSHPHLSACLAIYKINLTKLVIVSKYYSGGTLLNVILKHKMIQGNYLNKQYLLRLLPHFKIYCFF